MEEYNATVYERGNGLPKIGDYVAGNDGEVYKVIAVSTQITTNGIGVGNSIRATLEMADWSEIDDDNDPRCSGVLD